MTDELIERGPYAAITAVLIVPEPATFAILIGFLVILGTVAGRIAWAITLQLREAAIASSTAHPLPTATSLCPEVVET